ncbi:hypothetical protein ACN42_g7567 [Penicillium freii]|uniref:Uncharacterized protein n=1 Tax=Penicillium freii TaxID=48697 RepID=A0A101MFE5_PENFR|nr:hypothetical protein ACN42_g7567 [Penicillium freii]
MRPKSCDEYRKSISRSVVPKPSTGRMLLSAKTCRGCRSLPKAGKWDSAAFDFRLSTRGSMCLENHQFTFKETSFIESKAILSHIWHRLVGLDTAFRCPVKKLKLQSIYI